MRSWYFGFVLLLAVGPVPGHAEVLESVLSLGDIRPPIGLKIGGIAAGDLLGTAVAADGDFNGDGWFDLAVSAPGVDVGGAQGLVNAGEVYVLFGGRGALAEGFDLDELRPANGGDGRRGFILQGRHAEEFMGSAIDFVGDVNGDGRDDLLIGSERLILDIGGGGAYLIFGRPDSDPMPPEFPLSTLIDADDQAMNSGFGVIFRSAQLRGLAGHDVAGVGDINGDGVADFVIGNDFPGPFPPDSIPGGAGENPSATYVVYGRRAGFAWPASLNLVFVGLSNGDGSQGFTLLSNQPGNHLGSAVASPGDFTGDGIADLVLGSPFDDTEEDNGGGAIVVAGRVSGPGVGFDRGLDLRNAVDREQVNMLTGPTTEELLGERVAGIGDINDDTHPDLAIGTTFGGLDGARSGAIYVLFGQGARDPLPTRSSLGRLLPENGGDGSAGFVLSGAVGDQLGSAISPLGDVSGDGVDDFIVGAKTLALSGTDSGGAYVIFGRPAGTPFPARVETRSITDGDGSLGFALTGESHSDLVGEAFAKGWDVNGDGGHDVVVGTRFADVAGSNDGRLYVLYGAGNGARRLHGRTTRAWFDPARAGEGILTEVGTLDGQPALFATWYTYQDGEQLWLAAGPLRFTPGTARLSTELVVTGGGEFGAAFDPGQISFQTWGSVEVEIFGCDRLAWRYQQADGGTAGELSFVPLLPRLLDLPVCTGSQKSLSFGTVLGRELSGAWWNPQRGGEGIVIDIEDRGPQPTAFLSWFTYAGGAQRWLVGSAGIDPAKLELEDIPLTVTRGPQFGAAFDPAAVDAQPWGSAGLRFESCDRAVLTYAGRFPDGEEHSGSIELVRFTNGLYDLPCVDR